MGRLLSLSEVFASGQCHPALDGSDLARELHQVAERTVLGREVGPVAVLNDAAPVKNGDSIAALHRGQPMGDDNGRSAPRGAARQHR